MQELFECKDENGDLLNSLTFSTEWSPGYCLGMSLDWAKTVLTLGAVKTVNMLHPGVWALIQSAYESNARLKQPDAISVIKGQGLEVLNGKGSSEDVPFSNDFGTLANVLHQRVGTYIIYLGGAAGAGGHFMGFRRKGTGQFLLAEWFDPSHSCFALGSEAEYKKFIEEYLNNYYAGGANPGGKADPDFRDYACIAELKLAVDRGSAGNDVQGIGKQKFNGLRDMFTQMGQRK